MAAGAMKPATMNARAALFSIVASSLIRSLWMVSGIAGLSLPVGCGTGGGPKLASTPGPKFDSRASARVWLACGRTDMRKGIA